MKNQSKLHYVSRKLFSLLNFKIYLVFGHWVLQRFFCLVRAGSVIFNNYSPFEYLQNVNRNNLNKKHIPSDYTHTQKKSPPQHNFTTHSCMRAIRYSPNCHYFQNSSQSLSTRQTRQTATVVHCKKYELSSIIFPVLSSNRAALFNGIIAVNEHTYSHN